jgi:outer membrane protein OmpA-like peptidoglycan-associated protein
MRTLLTGFVIFLLWSSLSAWFYVCKVKQLCGDPPVVTASPPEENRLAAAAADSVVSEPLPVPEKLTVLFNYNKSEVLPDAGIKSRAESIHAWLLANPQGRIEITGYADSRGTEEYNLQLGKERAMSAARYLESFGVSTGKLSTFSKGESDPIADNRTEEGRSKNRRAEIIIK